MKVIIQNAEGNQIASLEIGAEYGYEQFIVANSLEGCTIVNKWYSEEDGEAINKYAKEFKKWRRGISFR